MNKIMELAKNAVEIGCSHMLGGASFFQVETAWRNVQAEVTRLETEVADLHVEIDTCHRRMIAEGAKLAALEAQEPVGIVVADDDDYGRVKGLLYQASGVVLPIDASLYIAAGAKESNHG